MILRKSLRFFIFFLIYDIANIKFIFYFLIFAECRPEVYLSFNLSCQPLSIIKKPESSSDLAKDNILLPNLQKSDEDETDFCVWIHFL